MSLIKWESVKDISEEYSYSYWNNIDEEKKKSWWVESPSEINKLKNYLIISGLQEEFEISIKYLKEYNLLKGKVLDVASGVCWTSSELSKFDKISSIDALEFSYHRINDIAPNVIEGLNGNSEKIRRIFGSFYNIKEQGYDLIFMSQAFHHSERPFELLSECNKALNKNGAIILIGEHLINYKKFIKRIIKMYLKRKKIITNFYKLFPPDDILGDHYYRISDYYFMFESLGYSVLNFKSNVRNSMIVLAIKK